LIDLQAFTIFCGLGINNCLVYDEKAIAAAKQAVALEVKKSFVIWTICVSYLKE